MQNLYSARRLNETAVGLFPVMIALAIILTSSIGGFLYVKELEKQEYFLNLTAEHNNDFADLKKTRQ